jgi:Glycosyl hydrolase catalytic core
MRRTAVLAITMATLGVLLAVPSANAKGGSSFYGLDYTFTFLHDQDAGKLVKSGAKTVRWTFFWPRIQTNKGPFDWSGPDKLVGALASRGIRVMPTLDGSPKWVADRTVAPPLGSHGARNAWKDFLRAAVKRYGPGGQYWTTKYLVDHPGKKALPIKDWQIWNEPNLESHFAPHPSPGRYARLLKISHEAIRGADSHAKVMFAGMPGYSNDIDAWSFLKRVYKKHGAKHDFDIAALHPYARNVNQMLGEVGRLRKVMRKNGDRKKPLWITEIGWGSGHPTRFGLTKGKRGQARILKHALPALKRKRHHWHIDRAVWFNFRDPAGSHSKSCSFCSSSGLLKSNLKPKPSWSAFRHLTH